MEVEERMGHERVDNVHLTSDSEFEDAAPATISIDLDDPEGVTSSSGQEQEPRHRDSSCQSSEPCQDCETVKCELETAMAALKLHFETEMSRVRREMDSANKGREMIVMRYANSEKEVIKQKRDLENFEKQVKNLNKEIEHGNKKHKMLSSERERLALMVDGKVNELQTVQKECDRLKEDNSSKEFKLKWTQNKLNAELDAHKETQRKLDVTTTELKDAVDDVEKMRRDCQDMIASCSPDSSLALTVDPPEKARSVEGSVDEDAMSSSQNALCPPNPFQKEVETLKHRHRSLIDENNSLSTKVQNLEKERVDLEQKVVRLRESNAEHLQQIATLQSELTVVDTLRSQLQREHDRVSSIETECESLRETHSQSLSDMAICRGKEAELLAYTQQVTEKNVLLQSEFSSVEAKSIVLEKENESLREEIGELRAEMKQLEKRLSQEKKVLTQEKTAIEETVQGHEEAVSSLQTALDEAKGEIALMTKKHSAAVRELTRELQLTRKLKTETAEVISQSSRTSSSSSLNNIENNNSHKTSHSLSTMSTSSSSTDIHQHHHHQQQNHDSDRERDLTSVVPDQQVLIERIVRLQRTLAKKQEKIEFLQEHGKQLVEELQKKCRIIQAYAMSQDGGALVSDLSEQNKTEIMKHGGIMASMYGSKTVDEGLTLELSLEMNQKFQAVLEDALLKNITLKENMNTLGKEISKLSEENLSLWEKVRKSNANRPVPIVSLPDDLDLKRENAVPTSSS